MNCPNCSYDIRKEDKYCSNCGQKNTSLKIGLKEFLSSFFQEYLSFDTRFFRSIGPLLFKPGFLAEKFFEGKRLTYVNPLRLYIFVSFLGFLLAGLSELNVVNIDGDDGGKIDIELNENVDINSFSNKVGSVEGEKVAKAVKIVKDNEDGINRNFLRYTSFSLFLLMPIFALITYLVFMKRKEYYLQHLILAFNIHTFFFIVLVISILCSLIFGINTIPIVLVLLSVYTFLSMKNYFKTTWGGTIWRFLLSIAIYNAFLLIIVLGVAMLSLYFSGASELLRLGN